MVLLRGNWFNVQYPIKCKLVNYWNVWWGFGCKCNFSLRRKYNPNSCSCLFHSINYSDGGGNVGVQSSAIVVQSLARGDKHLGKFLPKILKEASVGVLNGLLLASMIFGIACVFATVQLGFVVSLSLFTVIIFAAILGTIIPLVLNKYKIDPALATGPFITTLNDVIGLFIYFTIGMLLLEV
jgi:Mg/Co/Ni transporter MgtE